MTTRPQSDPHRTDIRALVIGAGPAGLMAAEVLSEAGVSVVVADQMPTPARKFLMAGKSGLNLTKEDDRFTQTYGAVSPAFARAISAFGLPEVTQWATGLGQEVFVGSTGRVFPVAMKASPLLRAWLGRLDARGVQLRTRWRWTGWRDGRSLFDTPEGPQEIRADVTILAMGGASWRRLGSDGAWAARFPDRVAPFGAANVGLRVEWSAHMARWHGAPIKGVAWHAGELSSRGEAVIAATGLEGGGIYSVSRAVREGAPLAVDLLPDLSPEAIRERLAGLSPKQSLATRLRKALRIEGARAALLNEFGRPFGSDLASTIKALPINHAGLMPMDDAISTSGGLRFSALDGFRLKDHDCVYAAGEMLDWEAPTGGWLITGCLATGRAAALQALADLGVEAGA
ncbi:TIGR03862 family flavoprotein [Rubricoccus marinus]|uniref:NAD(FAD)-utilizing dehydrogenase n=1 Tax=Rubricoccus marinus TaxID=716817 RepID=A0A259TZG2_9BACT|nr:TIGR03862 family flavoprotein [Rubricoccus marinus]OZC02968.1 NAD(FAD)-utilizing dehydrogenase [Rubricoccus marinus]